MTARKRLALTLLLTSACGGTTEPPVAPPAPPPMPAPMAAAPTPPADAPPVADAGQPAAASPPQLAAKAVPLPGVNGPASLDYIAYEKTHGRVWVPVGNTGSVDVLDLTALSFTRVDGFKTVERDVKGKKRTMGPSAAYAGEGVVYVGNRATNEVCPVNDTSLKPGKCLTLPSPTDGVAYVASAKEVWVTTPRDQSLTVLDASKPEALKAKTVVKTAGAPEGYAVDETHGLFFTNLEDKDQTVIIDVKTHKTTATFSDGCGSDGPRGIAVDVARGFVFVACTARVQVMQQAPGAHEYSAVASLDTGAGVDNIDWLEPQHLLYVGAGKAAKLTIAKFDDHGQPTVVATVATAEGARNAVADANGNAYLADPMHGGILVVPFPAL